MNPFERKLYKSILQIEGKEILLPSTKELTGMCGREIIAHIRKLNLKNIHNSTLICCATSKSIKNN